MQQLQHLECAHFTIFFLTLKFWITRIWSQDLTHSWNINTLQLCYSNSIFFLCVLLTWTFLPLDQALFDLWDLRTGVAKGWRVLEDLPCAGLLATLEPTGSTGPSAGAPLAPLTHLAVHCFEIEKEMYFLFWSWKWTYSFLKPYLPMWHGPLPTRQAS